MSDDVEMDHHVDNPRVATQPLTGISMTSSGKSSNVESVTHSLIDRMTSLELMMHLITQWFDSPGIWAVEVKIDLK